MRRVWILVPATLLLAACGGSSNKSSTAAGPPLQTISLSEKEFAISPGTISVAKTGTYAFHVTNHGTIGHALEVKGQGVDGKIGTINPGSSATLTITLSKTGGYEVYCPIDSHRDKGMKATLTVGASSGSGGMTTTSGTTTVPATTTNQKTTTTPGY